MRTIEEGFDGCSCVHGYVVGRYLGRQYFIVDGVLSRESKRSGRH